MLLSTDLLARFLSATGKQPGKDAAARSDVTVPNSLQPVISVSGPLANFSGFQRGITARESTVTSLSVVQPASSAAVTNDLITFGRGTWRTRIIHDSVSDFTAGQSDSASLQMVDPKGSAQVILKHWAIINQPQHSVLELVTTFLDDGWKIQLVNVATAAAQNLVSATAISAERLS